MLNIGAGELALIFVVALLVLGPTRLPELARGLGKLIREFRRHTDDVRHVVEREFYRMDEQLNTPLIPDLLAPPEQTIPATPSAESLNAPVSREPQFAAELASLSSGTTPSGPAFEQELRAGASQPAAESPPLPAPAEEPKP